MTVSSNILGDADRTALIEGHTEYVRKLAARLRREIGASHLELEELVAYGMQGLVEAASRFDPSRGAAFTTFSYYRIRGAIFDNLRELSWFPQSHAARFAAGSNELVENLAEREPDPSPGASTEQVLGELAEALDGVAAIFVASIDDHPVAAEGTDSALLLEQKQASRAVREALVHLPDKERELLESHYFEGLTLQDAGKRLGLSKSWASRLHARAVRLLADHLRADFGPSGE